MQYLPLAVILMAASAAQAQYKCTTPAGVTFQQTPCPKGATERQVGPKPVAPPKKPRISSDRPAHIREAYERGMIVAGMYLHEVTELIGRPPDRTNATVTAEGQRNQHIFEYGRRKLYLYVTDDVVTAVQSVEY